MNKKLIEMEQNYDFPDEEFDSILEDFGQRFEQMLSGYNIQDVAIAIGITKPTLYKIMKGKGNITLCNLMKIIIFFNVTFDYLLGFSDDPSSIRPIEPDIKKRLDSMESKIDTLLNNGK